MEKTPISKTKSLIRIAVRIARRMKHGRKKQSKRPRPFEQSDQSNVL